MLNNIDSQIFVEVCDVLALGGYYYDSEYNESYKNLFDELIANQTENIAQLKGIESRTTLDSIAKRVSPAVLCIIKIGMDYSHRKLHGLQCYMFLVSIFDVLSEMKEVA